MGIAQSYNIWAGKIKLPIDGLKIVGFLRSRLIFSQRRCCPRDLIFRQTCQRGVLENCAISRGIQQSWWETNEWNKTPFDPMVRFRSSKGAHTDRNEVVHKENMPFQ